MYNVLIVDDEFLARKLLQGYVEKMPELNLAGTCQNASEAFRAVQAGGIDILLLDIHLPDLNGIDFARTCKQVPAIIFTTAYSEYAVDSYTVSAVDYLLKPIVFGRFEEAIGKACRKIDGERLKAQEKQASGKEEGSPADEEGYLLVKADYRLYKINYADLLYIEGQHEYVSFYTTGKRITALYSLKSLEETQPEKQFVRVHKSYIVSIPHIRELGPQSLMLNSVRIPIGGSYREALLKRLGIQ
ncbi:MAG: response regulator transcription factor [Bacteroidales bacterium]|nr:response regulator transcription factor [Bacteroidales bacterium]